MSLCTNGLQEVHAGWSQHQRETGCYSAELAACEENGSIT